MKVIAKTPIKYNGTRYGIGEEIEVEEKDLEQINHIVEVPEKKKKG